MNILEILKEKKQIIKISAIALVGAASAYMIPAHISKAILPTEKNLAVLDSTEGSQRDTVDSKGELERDDDETSVDEDFMQRNMVRPVSREKKMRKFVSTSRKKKREKTALDSLSLVKVYKSEDNITIGDEYDKNNLEEIRSQMHDRTIIAVCPDDFDTPFSEAFRNILMNEYKKNECLSEKPIIYFGHNVRFIRESFTPKTITTSTEAINADIFICGSRFSTYSFYNNIIHGMCILFNPIIQTRHCFIKNIIDDGLFVVGNGNNGVQIRSKAYYLAGAGLMKNPRNIISSVNDFPATLRYALNKMQSVNGDTSKRFLVTSAKDFTEKDKTKSEEAENLKDFEKKNADVDGVTKKDKTESEEAREIKDSEEIKPDVEGFTGEDTTEIEEDEDLKDFEERKTDVDGVTKKDKTESEEAEELKDLDERNADVKGVTEKDKPETNMDDEMIASDDMIFTAGKIAHENVTTTFSSVPLMVRSVLYQVKAHDSLADMVMIKDKYDQAKLVEIKKQVPNRTIIAICPNFQKMSFSKQCVSVLMNECEKIKDLTEKPIIYFGHNVSFCRNSFEQQKINADVVICGSSFFRNAFCDNTIHGMCIVFNPDVKAKKCFSKNIIDDGLFVVGNDYRNKMDDAHYSMCHTRGECWYLFGEDLMSKKYRHQESLTSNSFCDTLSFALRKLKYSKLKFSIPGMGDKSLGKKFAAANKTDRHELLEEYDADTETMKGDTHKDECTTANASVTGEEGIRVNKRVSMAKGIQDGQTSSMSVSSITSSTYGCRFRKIPSKYMDFNLLVDDDTSEDDFYFYSRKKNKGHMNKSQEEYERLKRPVKRQKTELQGDEASEMKDDISADESCTHDSSKRDKRKRHLKSRTRRRKVVPQDDEVSVTEDESEQETNK